uniref:ADP-ribosyl cyclase/cyclic ADP-ribose hydrolase n=1 Tax=Takifugu rubripes TaxID=31033 RepID=A0A674NQN6_TAKRU
MSMLLTGFDFGSCPGWSACERHPVYSLWCRASQNFAEMACGNVTVLLNGSVVDAFNRESMFGSVELDSLDPCRVDHVNIKVVTDRDGPFMSDCETIWSTFEQAYVGRDPRKIPKDAYNPLFQVAPITTPRDKTMFWSKTERVVHAYNDKTKCFVTMEDTLLGSVLNNLSWCGKEGSSETFTSGCPDWNACKDNKYNPVRSFWTQGSAKFAEAACGDATVMLDGSIATPFNTSSFFAMYEVPNLNSAKVRKLTVVLVTATTPVSECANESLDELRRKLDSNIIYECKEVSETRINECASNNNISCTDCW